jgi:uncharacterized protein (TIGR02118 family)
MTFVYEIVLTGAAASADQVRAWFDAQPAPMLKRLPGLSALDLYRAVDGTDDPYNKDEGPPLLLAVAEFQTHDALSGAAMALEQALARLPVGVDAAVTAMERHFYPVGGETAPAPLRAPFSYVVRYRRPAEDEAAFVAHYVADHPRLEAQFPRIRSIMCYLPIAVSGPRRHPSADYMLGNEVVFDSIEDFNAAMQSPVRHEMRKHFHSFPKFSGPVTHFAMQRQRLVG